MATRLKTIEYWFPILATAVDASDTNFTQITLYIPDLPATTGTSFKSVLFECVYHDRNTTLGNISRHQVSISLGGATYATVNNANAITNGGEQQTLLCSGDFTSHFNSNWTNGVTSETCDARILLDSAVASPLNPAFSNISGRLIITYEYDDTKTTQIKTVRIPLNCPVGAMGTSKPGSANDTIPALDTELPETTKAYRQATIVLQGNDNGTSTDLTFNMQIDSLGAPNTYASQAYEHGSNCAMFVRMHHIVNLTDVTDKMTTNATHSFYVWANNAGNHMQAWMVVTYEFDASASGNCFVSLMLPAKLDGPMGGTTSSDYNRLISEIWVAEPATITSKQIAFYAFWDQMTAISALYMRVGTGSFVTYTDAAAVLAGSNASMIRNDSAFTIARGKNTLTADFYRSDATDLGHGLCGFWIVNYTCGKPSGGYGAASHTVIYPLLDTGTAAVSLERVTGAVAPSIPESEYFLQCAGAIVEFTNSGTATHSSATLMVERLSAEGGVKWENIFSEAGATDGETGIYHMMGCALRVIKRWSNDPDATKFNIETARRYKFNLGQTVSGRGQLKLCFTYHTITFAVAGSVSGSASGTVNLDLRRVSDGVLLLTTSRSGNGAFSFNWFDDTADVEVIAHENDTHCGASKRDVAGT